ncbi:hypothetical protein L1049_008943 [Liquidambar formosana]|uniref:Protein LURP-one-related 5-like n=1 Tax=Liquidambar formosana TaxID=63359 RepID=A0AAP0X602_LIQFO
MSCRIHPAAEIKCRNLLTKSESVDNNEESSHNPPCRPSVLTVWKRSSMSFQGTDGFTVFDGHGRLAFRVDNYSRKNECVAGGGLVLMDGAGKALLTLKPQIFSMQHQWNGYGGGDDNGCGGKSDPILCKVFSMRRRSALVQRQSEDEAEVFMMHGAAGRCGTGSKKQHPDFRISGSFRRRNCKITSPTGELVANIARKKVIVNTTILLSDDVFSLVIQPGFHSHLIMAFLIILDRISAKPFVPAFCS